MIHHIPARFLGCVSLCLSLAVTAFAEPMEEHALKPYGYGADAAEVRRCLAQFVPDENRQKEIARLIKQLGNDDFLVREKASTELGKFAILPRAELHAAAKAGDPEIKARVDQLLRNRSNEHSDKMLHAALRQIIALELEGLTPDVLAATRRTDIESFWSMLTKALIISSTENDVDLLTKTLADARPDLRAAAVEALVHVEGEKAADTIKPLLKDKDDRVVLRTAVALANLGDRVCLRTFVQLLESKWGGVRLGAVRALRHLSGQEFGYQVSGDEPKRSKAIAAWREWVETAGKTAKLNYPLEERTNALYNSHDLTGWKVYAGKLLDDAAAAELCKADGEILHVGKSRTYGAYLRTEQRYTNYTLSFEYRWPKGSATADSGLHLFHTGGDSSNPKCLEVQMHQGNAGDLYAIGGFSTAGDGKLRTGVASRKEKASEVAVGEWNKIEVEVLDGKFSVKVNGVLQNEATGCPKEPGYIGFRLEGYAFDLRNITLDPL